MPNEFPNKWAILFACKDYELKDLATLEYPIADVVEFKKALHDYLEFPEDHFLTFGEGLQHPPEYSTFWDKLGNFLNTHPVKEDDLLLFYFTGHGFREDKDYLLPQRASLNNPRKTGIAVEDVIAELLRSKCKNIVMFLDACRSPMRGAKGAKGIGEQSADLMEKNEVLCFFSCYPEEQSWEIEELQHSSFTYCVLEALRGAKCATAAEMDTYLLQEVPLLNAKYKKGQQKPYSKIIPTEKGMLPIFASNIKRQQETDEYEAIIQKLLDLHEASELAENYYEEAVELLVIIRDKERDLRPDEAFRWEWVKKLCNGRVKPKIFVATWQASKKRSLGGAVT
jgi:hypothetical protein